MKLVCFVFILWISEHLSQRILLLQSSDTSYNRQPWEGLVDYTLVELSQIDVLNYAQLHGYDYKRILTNEHMKYKAHPSWTKVDSLLSSISKMNYDFVVVLDLDIFFMNSSQSIVEKIREWDPDNLSMVYMPQDTDEYTSYLTPFNTTSFILNVNTGFQIWKVNEVTIEMAKRWKECMSTYKECAKWSNQWPFDQGAFNQFIRPQLEAEKHFTTIPCDEANGFPSEYDNYLIESNGELFHLGNHNCNGRFVSHFWEETKRYNHKKLEEFLKRKYFEQQLNRIKRDHTLLIGERCEASKASAEES